ncbi:MAG: glycosyltransferase [Fretibacterium sp.]|nr:glycosyltransferase [Fretibacterium sp.]
MKDKTNAPKGILHVTKAYFPKLGGVETVVRQLAEGASAEGHRVSVLCCGEQSAVEEINGVTIHRYQPFLNVGSAPLSFRFMLKLWQLMKQHDIIHFHVPNPVGELAFCLSPYKRRVKSLCTYHLDPVRPKSFVRVYKVLLHSFLKCLDVICPTSPNYVRSSDILQQHQKSCLPIPLGAEVSRFTEVSSSALAEAERAVESLKHPRVLFCGRFSYYKGLSYLLEAIAQVPDASLILVGRGEKEAELKEQAAALGLEGRMLFLDHLPDELYPAIYHTADLFVLPSAYRSEAFGIVSLEAMAAGLPLVTTELGTGTSFYNVDGETGFVVPPMDPDALAEAINKLLTDRELASQMGLAARKRVDDFDLSRMLRSYLDLYEELLSEATKGDFAGL